MKAMIWAGNRFAEKPICFRCGFELGKAGFELIFQKGRFFVSFVFLGTGNQCIFSEIHFLDCVFGLEELGFEVDYQKGTLFGYGLFIWRAKQVLLKWSIMENPSSLGFDSDESDPDMQTEAYEDHERIEDKLPNNLDLCAGEDDKIVGESVINREVLEPYIGMEFNSRDEAREFYVAYGRRTGFTVRIHHNRRSRVNNQVIGQDFVCSKEGFRAKKYVYRKDRVLPPPPITREGCQAMIRLALRDGAKWVVTKFVKEHSHKLMSPSKVPWRGSGKHLVSEDEKDKRIRELSLELYNERQKCKRRCAAYEEQLNMILKDLEKHTEHMSRKVSDIVQSIKEIEEQSEDSDKEWS